MEERSLDSNRPPWPICVGSQSMRRRRRGVAFLWMVLSAFFFWNACGGDTGGGGGSTTIIIPIPGVVVSPNPFDFGSQRVGTSGTVFRFTVMSTGTGNLILTGATYSSGAGFLVSDTTCSWGTPMAPQISCWVDMYFKPVIAGAVSGYLTLYSNADPNPYVVTLTGQGF